MRDPTSQPRFWAATVGALRSRLTPDYRVELVDTAGHWGAFYLARAGIPLARGWYRQDDFPQNSVLYGPLYSAQLPRIGCAARLCASSSSRTARRITARNASRR